MRSSRSWGSYTEKEIVALVDNYESLRFLRHRAAIHVRLMDIEVAMRYLPRKLRDVMLVYGIMRYEQAETGRFLNISQQAVSKRYHQGIEHMLYTLNGEE